MYLVRQDSGRRVQDREARPVRGRHLPNHPSVVGSRGDDRQHEEDPATGAVCARTHREGNGTNYYFLINFYLI